MDVLSRLVCWSLRAHLCISPYLHFYLCEKNVLFRNQEGNHIPVLCANTVLKVYNRIWKESTPDEKMLIYPTAGTLFFAYSSSLTVPLIKSTFTSDLCTDMLQ